VESSSGVLVRPEALAFRSDLCVIDEEVERLRPDDITGQSYDLADTPRLTLERVIYRPRHPPASQDLYAAGQYTGGRTAGALGGGNSLITPTTWRGSGSGSYYTTPRIEIAGEVVHTKSDVPGICSSDSSCSPSEGDDPAIVFDLSRKRPSDNTWVALDLASDANWDTFNSGVCRDGTNTPYHQHVVSNTYLQIWTHPYDHQC
jgi:hypothetical protein